MNVAPVDVVVWLTLLVELRMMFDDFKGICEDTCTGGRQSADYEFHLRGVSYQLVDRNGLTKSLGFSSYGYLR